MATIRRGSTASGSLLWTVPQSIALTSMPTGPKPPPVQPVPRVLSFGGYCFNGLHMVGLKSNCELRVVQGASVLFVYQGTTEIYSYVAGTPDGNLASLEQAITAAKGFGLPVIAYWPRSLQLNGSAVPKGADLIGVEAYQQEPTLAAWEARVRQSIARCSKVALLCQVYTSNATLTKNLTALVAPYSDLLNDYPRIKACLLFSGAGRPTGLQDHPEVLSSWAVVANSVKTPPLPTPPDPPDPPNPEPEPPVAFPTDAEFADFSTKLDTKYHTEAVPPRPAETTFVDSIGRGRWTYDYSLHRQQGDTHDQAWGKVNAKIDEIWHP